MSNKPGCLGFLFNRREDEDAVLLPYRVRDEFLSAAEHSFYMVLEEAVGDQFAVCPKVNLKDIFYVARPRDNFDVADKINHKHVDFLLCEKRTMKPVLGVELEDSSQESAARRERDLFVEDVFDTAKLPLARVFTAETYDLADLRSYLCDAAHRPDDEGRASAILPDPDPEQAEQPESGQEDGLEEEHPAPPRPDAARQGEKPALEAAQAEPGPAHPGQVPVEEEKTESEPAADNQEEIPAMEAAVSRSFFTPREIPLEPVRTGVPDPGDSEQPALAGPDPGRVEDGPAEKAPGNPALHNIDRMKQRVTQEIAAAASSGVPNCPQCAVPMVLRTSKRGIEFYHCPNFPNCREVRGLFE